MGAVFKDYKAFIREDMPEIYAVPETIDGEAVTCIGKRAFYGCKGLKQVILPKTITTIGDYAFAECRQLHKFVFPEGAASVGDYAFYNCMALKEIVLGKNISAIGYGAFKNCLELDKITMDIAPGRKNCLNSILQDEFQEVDVTLHYMDDGGNVGDVAHLVFTDYQYEYVPEIEARQFNWETYGSGDSYRISIRDTDIDYEKYDSVFSLAQVEDDENTLLKIVAGRLCWPHKLSDESRERYEAYVKAHMRKILEQIIGGNGPEAGERLFDYLLKRRLLTPEDVDFALDLCSRISRASMTAQLMDYQGAKKPKAGGIRSRFAL